MSRWPRGGRFIRFDIDDPADLARLTRSGLIWTTPYVEQGVGAIRSGLVRLDQCRDMPDTIRALFVTKAGNP